MEAIRQRFSVQYDPQLGTNRPKLFGELSEAKVLVVRNQTRVDQELLDQSPNLSMVGRLGVGLDNIDLAACEAREITVRSAQGANAVAVAEWVITAILILSRRCFGATEEVIAGAWPREKMIGEEVAGKMLGLVGMGHTAQMVAKRAQALEMEVSGTDPFLPSSDPRWTGINRLTLEPLLASADVVSLHVPLTLETEKMINPSSLSLMKPGALLINSSRGGIVDEEAVRSALLEGKLGGAALDVFRSEPMTAETGTQWLGVPNLLLTPHVAGLTVQSQRKISDLIARAVIDHLS